MSNNNRVTSSTEHFYSTPKPPESLVSPTVPAPTHRQAPSDFLTPSLTVDQRPSFISTKARDLNTVPHLTHPQPSPRTPVHASPQPLSLFPSHLHLHLHHHDISTPAPKPSYHISSTLLLTNTHHGAFRNTYLRNSPPAHHPKKNDENEQESRPSPPNSNLSVRPQRIASIASSPKLLILPPSRWKNGYALQYYSMTRSKEREISYYSELARYAWDSTVVVGGFWVLT